MQNRPTTDAAEILGLSQNTLRAWAREGKFPMHQNPANRYRLFRRSDLQDCLKKIE
jgi:excisionase family DNA binding protein